jgi:hypothetical protein
MLYEETMNQCLFIDFMSRLIKDTQRKVFFIVDNLKVHLKQVDKHATMRYTACSQSNEGGADMDSHAMRALDDAFYRFAVKCFKEHLEIVFTGGCLFRHLMKNDNSTDAPVTKDADLNVSETDYSLIDDTYQNAVKFGKLRPDRDGADRMYNMKLFDGGCDCDVRIVSAIDMSIIRVYNGPYGYFYGVCVEDMLADKLASMSNRYIIECAEDIPGVYRILTASHITVDIQLLLQLLNKRSIGDFSLYAAKDKQMIDNIEELGYNFSTVAPVCDRFIRGLQDGSHATKSWRQKYTHLPIIVAGESMADILGWTSVVGKLQYIGDKKYENRDLCCLSESGYTGNSFMGSGGQLRFMSNIETLCSLVEYDCSHWGLRAICHALRCLHMDVKWYAELSKRGLEQRLVEKLTIAVELNEDDESVFNVLTAWKQQADIDKI